MRYLLVTIVAVMAMTIVWGLGVPKTLGAHPWWADKVIFIGAPIGILIGMASMVIRDKVFWRLAGFAALTILSYWIAKTGGEAFAASYAEDALAGKRWYFGWIATMAGLASVFVTLAESAFERLAKEKG